MKFLHLFLVFLFLGFLSPSANASMDVVFPKKQTQFKSYFIHTATPSNDKLQLLSFNPVTRKAEIKLVSESELCSHTDSLFTRENTWSSVTEAQGVLALYPSLDSNCDKVLNDLYNGPGTVALCTQQQLYNVNGDIVTKNGTVSASFLTKANQLFFESANPEIPLRLSTDPSKAESSYISDSWWTNIVAVGGKMSFSWVLPSLYSNLFVNVNDDNTISLVDVPPGNRVIPTTRWMARFSNPCLN